MLDRDTVLDLLAQIPDPVQSGSVVTAGRTSGLVVRDDGSVGLVLEVGDMEREAAEQFAEKLRNHLIKGGAGTVRIVQTAERDAPRPVPGVRHVLAVGAGKGGVGKSTVAVNLARALKRRGLKIGILDADIQGPSVHLLLGVDGKASATPDKKLIPLVVEDMEMLSMGVMADPDKALAWRGPMVAGAVVQMAQSANWGNLDLLVVDLPPGTGDVHLALAQKLAPSGAIVITTPQKLALADARRASGFYRRLSVPFFGYVSNMEGQVFGQVDADTLDAPLLASLPLEQEVVTASDACEEPVGHHREAMDALAEAIASRLML